MNRVDRWPGVGLFRSGNELATMRDVFSTASDPILEITNRVITGNQYPQQSYLQRDKMSYHNKFGEFGVSPGQFTEPSGIAVNPQGDIYVCDTNNHRVQVFRCDGAFLFQFGGFGKEDGQMLYPNRIAIVPRTGDIVITERSPTHQVQVYTQWGTFVRRFGADVLEHPRGIAIDSQERIIVIECKVMRVVIFDIYGRVINQFHCGENLEFPNGVAVNDRDRIFISDNRAHCVKVFTYSGQYLYNIGGESLTNYPIGVGIGPGGHVVIADNHNNFNLTKFTQEGTLVGAYESKVKHAQCFDMALMTDGTCVLASKDYRIYVYNCYNGSYLCGRY